MATLVTDCPHCKAQMVGFTFTSSYAKPGSNSVTHYVTGSCNACHRPITASVTLENAGVWDPKNYQGDVLHSRGLRVNAIWPASEKITAPSSVPDKVARSYMEAAEARSRSSWNAACATYRRTMELALKAFAPEIDAWKLEKRIDKLAAEHRITTDIQTWAHELRLDGNEALHGDEDATPEMTEQMHHLTHFLLIYLYTLPKQIEAARERRDV